MENMQIRKLNEELYEIEFPDGYTIKSQVTEKLVTDLKSFGVIGMGLPEAEETRQLEGYLIRAAQEYVAKGLHNGSHTDETDDEF